MGALRRRRWLAALLVATLVASMAPVGTAAACEESQIQIAAVARGYDYSTELRFLDGIVTNDSSITVLADHVNVGWLEEAARAPEQVWLGCRLLAPGEWTTFHEQWPCGVPETLTPDPVGFAYDGTGKVGALELTLGGVSGPTLDGNMRVYTATVTNPNAFPVSSIEVIGVERDNATSAFVDTLWSWDIPDVLAPGETKAIEVRGKSPWVGSLTPTMRFEALERPVITLTPNTLTPSYGTPITFQINLTHADGTPVTGCRTVKIYYSYDGENWDHYYHWETTTGAYTAQIVPDRPTYYKAVYWGDDDLGWTMSGVLFAQPRVVAGTPSAPTYARPYRSFTVSGRMCAGVYSAGKPVKVFVYKYRYGHWVKKASYTTSADAAGRFRKSMKLYSRGTYRVKTYRYGVGYSRSKYVRVR